MRKISKEIPNYEKAFLLLSSILITFVVLYNILRFKEIKIGIFSLFLGLLVTFINLKIHYFHIKKTLFLRKNYLNNGLLIKLNIIFLFYYLLNKYIILNIKYYILGILIYPIINMYLLKKIFY